LIKCVTFETAAGYKNTQIFVVIMLLISAHVMALSIIVSDAVLYLKSIMHSQIETYVQTWPMLYAACNELES